MYGWMQDIPHPHNWVVPWLIGTYATRQSLPDTLQSVYETKINQCIVLTGDAARLCYEDIQTSTYNDALDIFLLQSRIKTYVRAELQGYHQNLMTGGPLMYYALSKAPLPAAATVSPEEAGMIEFDSAVGATGSLSIPTGTIDSPISFVISPDVIANGRPTGFHLSDLSFEILAHDSAGAVIADPTLNHPLHLMLSYTPDSIRGMLEDTLQVFWWDGGHWVDAACGDYVRNMENNTLEVDICHLSTFALGGASYDLYAPAIFK